MELGFVIDVAIFKFHLDKLIVVYFYNDNRTYFVQQVSHETIKPIR